MKKNKYLLVVCCMLAFASCRTRIGFDKPELPKEDTRIVRVAPIWGEGWQQPSMLSALVYTPEGALQGTYPVPAGGGEFTLPYGKYRMILYSPDTESVVFSSLDVFDQVSGCITQNTKSGYSDIPCSGRLYSSMLEVADSVSALDSPMIHYSIGVTIKLKVEEGSALNPDEFSVALRNIADAINLSTGQAYHTANSSANRTWLTSSGVVDGFYVFTGMAFGGCVEEHCQSLVDHNVYADIAMVLPDGTNKTLTADITDAIREAQESVTEISIEVNVKDLGLQVEVVGWTVGSASGGVGGPNKRKI